jgi:hypothetical protein
MLMRKSKDSTDERLSAFSKNCRYISFLAVPHDGNAIATIASNFPVSNDVHLIANRDGYLQDLNDQFKNLASNNNKLKAKVFYGKHDVIVN